MGAAAQRGVDAGVEWSTPDDFFAGIVRRFGPFDLDAAASVRNAKTWRHYTAADDGAVQPWFGNVWCNPPYGRAHNRRWAMKAVHEADRCNLIAYLHIAAPETRWWNQLAERASQIHFVSPRLRFGGAANGGTFASCLFIFHARRVGPTFHRMRPDGSERPWTTPGPPCEVRGCAGEAAGYTNGGASFACRTHADHRPNRARAGDGA